MGKRYEFSPKTKKLALERSGHRCEAVGVRYGLQPGERCNADLTKTKIEHDHYPIPALVEGSNSLENDVVCCQRCNQFAANKFDKAREAKTRRILRKAGPVELRKRTKPIPSQASWPKAPKPNIPRPANGGWSKGKTIWAKRPFGS